jgi:hypothetical protein
VQYESEDPLCPDPFLGGEHLCNPRDSLPGPGCCVIFVAIALVWIGFGVVWWHSGFWPAAVCFATTMVVGSTALTLWCIRHERAEARDDDGP